MSREAIKFKRLRRRQYEFPNSTKQAAKERCKRNGGFCEECGKNKPSQFHHIVSVVRARFLGLSREEVIEPKNCLYVCSDCRIELDKDLVF